jgi:gamma-glutamyltranspeptidase/glutathione hydrolase
MPPPTSGGATVLQILKLLEPFDVAALEPNSLEAVHLITEAMRLAYADRDQYLADPDFVDMPLDALLDEEYLRARSRLIDPDAASGKQPPGNPLETEEALAPHEGMDLPSTSHFSVIDPDGNAVSMTASIEFIFGSRLMAAGMLLNNELTDFSFVPEKDGRPVANRVEPGKRPRSSMSPTIVFDEDGELYALIGSPGGSRIIAYVAKTLIAMLDWDLPVQEAIALPHFLNRNGRTELEEDTGLVELKDDLEAMGHEVRITRTTSGLQGIVVHDDGYEGGADPRKEGAVIGR